MTVLIIIFIVLLVLFLLSLINVKIILEYKEKLSIVIKILFIKIDFIKKKDKKKPKKTKPKKNKKTKAKQTKEEKLKPKKKNPLKVLLDKQGVTGFVELLKDALRLVKGILGGFFKRLIIHNFNVKISFAGEDASDTAVGYGALCSVVYPIMGQLYSRLNVKDYTVDILCNFNQNAKTEVDCSLYATIRICHIISIAIKTLLKAGKTYINMRFKR